ncbi:MAG: stage V sporulation protein AC [Oscillospiraceae bacterium]|nr:stage V sporulation protein AC [Oscillospiraceae bacterium]
MKFPTQQQYSKMSEQYAPKSPIVKDCVWAFLIGGLICAFGQGLIETYLALGITKEIATGLCSVSLVFLSALLTGLGLYDDLATHAGAGTLVPITGFANSIASPAVEFKTEGLILGLGAKMFIIAGPVLVYGISASVIYGVIYYIISLF